MRFRRERAGIAASLGATDELQVGETKGLEVLTRSEMGGKI